jgi:hypothetical protein
MLRRRLLSLVGALGLVAGLLTSAVAVQAETEPSSLDAMVWNWSTSTQNACISNGQSVPLTGTSCVITQGPQAEDNLAICVQNNTSVQSCVITQTEDPTSPEDNRALVVQHINQSGGSIQNATQSVRITQTSGLGRNDAWVLQAISQSTTDPVSQEQNNNQADTIDQVSVSGGQSVGLGQVSWQNGQSGTATFQHQTSNQDVSESEGQGHHINQHSTGLSKILVGQLQTQKLHSGVTGAAQIQELDPRCCSFQQSNTADTFRIFQLDTQLNDHGTGSMQNATSVAQCDSSGNCSTSSTTSQNGTPTTVNCGPSHVCTAILVCDGSATCPTQVSSTCPDGCPPIPPPPCFPPCGIGLLPSTSLGNGALALALGSRGQTKPLARSAPSASRLT